MGVGDTLGSARALDTITFRNGEIRSCTCCIRGHPFMTSALRGGGGLENWLILRMTSTDRLHEMWTKGKEGVSNPKNFVDVINGWPLN